MRPERGGVAAGFRYLPDFDVPPNSMCQSRSC